MKLGSAAKQPWLVTNSATAIWNTYLPNLQQQRFAPVLDLLTSAVTMLLAQPDPAAVATQLTALAAAGAAAAEHAALLAVLAASQAPKDGEEALPAGMPSGSLPASSLLSAHQTAPLSWPVCVGPERMSTQRPDAVLCHVVARVADP